MTQFSLEEENESRSLEKSVSESTMSQETIRRAELDETKRKQMQLLREAEKIEQKYSGNNMSIAQLWDKAVEDVVRIYNQGQEITGIKKTVYDTLKKFKINMYEREANKILNSAQSKADKIKNKLDYVNNKLNNDIGEKGLSVILKEQREVATATANALVQSKSTIVEYSKEISSKEKELKELQKQAKANGKDYSTDIEYIANKIEELKEERKGVKEDIRQLGNKLQVSDAKIETKGAIIGAINLVYTKGMIAYSDLQSEIEIAREFVNNGNLIDQGLGKAIVDIEDAVSTTYGIVGMGNRLGKTLVDSTKVITEKLRKVTGLVRDKEYVDDIKKQTNEDRQEFSANLDQKIAKYATMPYT